MSKRDLETKVMSACEIYRAMQLNPPTKVTLDPVFISHNSVALLPHSTTDVDAMNKAKSACEQELGMATAPLTQKSNFWFGSKQSADTSNLEGKAQNSSPHCSRLHKR